ncbi:hypothetical protein [Arthrobacter sp. 35W]|uniref:hypothetical protein n=1 Tax=Arthrobacter sp. 35W TaxID=1132441 RepID=UPI00047914BB|nr:hypothetical protein [Arthrobacter sp. 35W]
MLENPMIRPPVVSTPLVVASVVLGLSLALAAAAIVATWPAQLWLVVLTLVLLTLSLLLGLRWTSKVQRSRRWRNNAQRQWHHLKAAKEASGTTTEVTILSIDEVQPTGAWATIRWNKFGYVQPAWLEAGPMSYWPGSVLLICPDPGQVKIGQPWPRTYWIHASDCRAMAPAALE